MLQVNLGLRNLQNYSQYEKNILILRFAKDYIKQYS